MGETREKFTVTFQGVELNDESRPHCDVAGQCRWLGQCGVRACSVCPGVVRGVVSSGIG
jgi:hypothetical protein